MSRVERLKRALEGTPSDVSDKRRGLRRLRGTVLIAVIGVLVIEGLLHAVGGSVPRPPLYPGDIVLAAEKHPGADDLVGWKMAPNESTAVANPEYSATYSANSLGFRSSREFTINAGDERIAVIGSSFTFGAGVAEEETFAALIGDAFEDTVSYNFAIGGFGVDQMMLTLEHYALQFEPSVVVCGLVRNTLGRCTASYRHDTIWRSKPAFTFEAGELVPLTEDNLPPAAWRFVQQHSRIFGNLRKLENSLLRNYAFGRQWRLNRAFFERMRDVCEAAGAEFMVVSIPVNRRKPIPMFAREFADMQIDYLDLQPLLPEDADALYYPADSHFNADGHRFAANAIEAFIRERGWLGN